MIPLRTFAHGSRGPLVVVLHGGPGAAGSVRPLALDLARSFRVMEPWQRGHGSMPLTVARHGEDLHALVQACPERPALVGHSWGAMLALAYGAAHPGQVRALALIGCGTFDPLSRRRLLTNIEARLDDALRARISALTHEIPDPDERLAAQGKLLMPLYSWDLMDDPGGAVEVDGRAHEETWQDMLRLQGEGVYPAAFGAIKEPVLMLHGRADPHPGRLIRRSLRPFIPHLEYREWERCGHYPWLEREVRQDFLAFLGHWLDRQNS